MPKVLKSSSGEALGTLLTYEQLLDKLDADLSVSSTVEFDWARYYFQSYDYDTDGNMTGKILGFVINGTKMKKLETTEERDSIHNLLKYYWSGITPVVSGEMYKVVGCKYIEQCPLWVQVDDEMNIIKKSEKGSNSTLHTEEFVIEDGATWLIVTGYASYNGISHNLRLFKYLPSEEIRNHTWIPNYYKEHIKEAAEKINSTMKSAGQNSLSFVFQSDPHWDSSWKQSGGLVNYLLDNTKIDMFVDGGDDLNGQPTLEDANAVLADYFKAMHLDRFKYVVRMIGNHDGNAINKVERLLTSEPDDFATDPTKYRVYNEGNEYFQKAPAGAVFETGKYYYAEYSLDEIYTANEMHYNYIMQTDQIPQMDGKHTGIFNHEKSNTMFIVIDTAGESRDGFQPTSDRTIANLLLDERFNGKNIVILSHRGVNGDNELKEKYLRWSLLFDAYNSRESSTFTDENSTSYAVDFSECTGAVRAWLCGHTHKDNHAVTSGGIPCISANSDSNRITLYSDFGLSTAPSGYINQQCFDVVTIDYSANKIKFIRVGRGSDREFDLYSQN